MLGVFEPARYSIEELHFLMEHLGKPPVVAMRQAMPVGVNPRMISPILTSVFERQQLQAADGDYQWSGIEAITESISRFLAWYDKTLEIRRRNITDVNGRPINNPSMYEWDDQGLAFPYAVGADAADMVRSEFTDDGVRRPFKVNLDNKGGDRFHISDVITWVKRDKAETVAKDDKIVDERGEGKKTATIRCTICDKAEQYNIQVPQSRRAAMARIHKHLKQAKTAVNRHRILLAKVQAGA